MTSLPQLFSDIPPDELIKFLLAETGQDKNEKVESKPILSILKLKHITLDVAAIPSEALDLPPNDPLRALLYYPEKVIGTDYLLPSDRTKFSVFHEIAHYVLPEHQQSLFLCSKSDMSQRTGIILEKQANQFAADLMFHADLFTRMAHEMPICAKTIKELAIKFEASFESTARRLIEKNIRPCLLIVYEKKLPVRQADKDTEPSWDVKYPISSTSFPFYLPADPMNHVVVKLGSEQFRDIADSVLGESEYGLPNGKQIRFSDEYFTNHFNVFRIMIPQQKGD